MDHDGELDKQTKKQPNYNAGGPKLCTPVLPIGLQPLNKDLRTADNKLEHFLNSTGGHFYAQQEHTWKGKECRAALDHVLTWNYHLPPQTTKPNPKSHKKFDHCQIGPNFPI